MARKNVLRHQILSAKVLDASFISEPTYVKFLDNVSYQITVTAATAEGTFKIQASNDFELNEVGNVVSNPGSWADLPLGGGTPTVSAANDTILIDLNQLPFNAIRVVYTSTVASGSDTCDIWIVGRQIGG